MKIEFSATLLGLLTISLAASQSIRNCEEITLRNVHQIDAGIGQVVAVDRNRRVYHLHGKNWYSMNTYMLHVTVGPAGIWGVDRQHYINKLVGGKWTRTKITQMTQVDAGGDMFVTAVFKHAPQRLERYTAMCLNRPTAMGFRIIGTTMAKFYMGRRLKYSSCGPHVCWLINYDDQVFITKTVNPKTCAGSNSMQRVSGSLSMVEVATDGSVYGVNRAGHVLRRNGISPQRPQGTSWTKIEVCLLARHVSYDLGKLWVVSRSGIALECQMHSR